MSPGGSTTKASPYSSAAVAPSSASYTPPSTIPGEAQRIIAGLIPEKHHLQTQPLSSIAAGKRPERRLYVDVDAATTGKVLPSHGLLTAKAPHSATNQYTGTATSSKDTPSLYKISRGRSANVSPSRRWDRRGASATVLSSTSGSGSGSGSGASGAESEMTVAGARADATSRQSLATSASQNQPASRLLLATQLPDLRPSLPRKPKSSRSRTSSARPLTASLPVAEEVDSDELTSSDEEGAHASRLARSRRASLERDRQRGMRILHAAARREMSEKSLSKEDLVLVCPSPEFTSASTSASATPTTPDELSDPSSAMSRSPSSEVEFLAVPSPDPMRRSRLHSEQGEAAFFGLADDEEDPTAAALSAQAFSAALLRRRRSRTRSGSGHGLHVEGTERKSANSLPSSRRPSIPSNVDHPAVRTSTSVPTRESTVLGFAPVSAGTASLGRRFGSPPRRLPWALSMSFGQAEKTAGDMLSGTSIASVEDYLKLDPVDWDDNDISNNKPARRSSVVSIRPGQSSLSNGGDATVAALEATSLLDEEEPSAAAPAVKQHPDSSVAEKQHKDLSDSEHEAARRSGFAMAYQHRLSNLQSQLRVLSNIASPASSTPPTGEAGSQPSPSPSAAVTDESRSSLLASSWRQIARLPNLFFPGARDQTGIASAPRSDESPSATTDGALVRSQSEEDILENASLSLSSLVSSPEASSITLSSDATQAQRSSNRRSSFTSRGVVSPLEGDKDPGAYVSGLGQSIDPDIELSSVVHLQAFRARGRSVDTSGGRHRKRFPIVDERATASDSERSPILAAKQKDDAPPALVLSSDTALVGTASRQAEASQRTNVKSRASFNLHDDETEEEGRKEDSQISRDTCHRDTSPSRSASLRTKVPDEDGFITISHHRRAARSRDAVRASRPAAEAPVPQNFSAFEGASGSGSSDEERPRVSKFILSESDDAEQGSSAPRTRVDSDDDQTSGRGRAGRGGRGRSRQASREMNVAPTRSRQCAVGLFTGRRASLTEEGPASMRSIRSSPNLTYAKVAANGNAVAKQHAGTCINADVGPSARPSMIRQRSEQGHSSDERSRSGRGRGDDVKVTSCSFSSDEHPRNSLPRSASSSGLLEIVKSGSLLKQKPLLSAPTGPGMSLPGSRRDASSRRTTFGLEGNLPGSSSAPSEAEGLSPSAVDIHQPSPQDQQSSGDVLNQPSARPTLLSNSAHLLMLSLELEMMRAQKITAPLKVRWVRQRMSVNPTSSPASSSSSSSSDGERGRDVAPRCQSGASTSHRYQPRRASRLRHFTTSA
ncbi:hypothetical protein BCV69DRAFT_284078 [Microstroma glucosiphilum]|uniref:Uncharacterized protein n=1 Tax=Pseudomicrostroma glucosiphilum TaxID=1684307 RepID=A0A316U2P6_9BASI|nr:hypothetical protein BCV69DRAFT_284078 [Pseudomicrostroma glucosiphilum]PWN19450.1 hypothetical protein BCV69DRAFT_284078 [Pseudomicrostroma glucosiphilum]